MCERQAAEPAGAARRPGRVAGSTFVLLAPKSSMRQPVHCGGREHRQVWGFGREWTTTDPAHLAALEWLNDVSKAVMDARLARAWLRDDLAESAGALVHCDEAPRVGPLKHVRVSIMRGRQRMSAEVTA